MFKLFPLLAQCYVTQIGAQFAKSLHSKLLQSLEKEDFSLLDLAHHVTSGFKSNFTKTVYEGLDNLRQACGGAGFSAFSALPLLQTEYAANTTFEGDNTVMAQQSFRFLFKNFKSVV